MYLEDLCFHAQQAAEKAVKAVLIEQNVEFPYVHDLGRLLELAVQSGISVSAEVRKADALTRFAVAFRYPGMGRPPSTRDHQRAVRLARAVVV